MELSERFKELRRQAGLTGTALARPRYTVSYVSQIETGRRTPSGEALAFFAERLGVSPRYLATGVPDGIEPALRYQLEAARRELVEEHPERSEGTARGVVAQATRYGLARIRAQALVELGEALRAVGDIRRAIDAYEEALEDELSPTDAGRAIGGMARAYRAVGDLSYAAQAVESFLAKGDRGPLEPSVMTDLQSVLVSIYFERGDVHKAERAARRALTAAEQQGSLQVRAVAYWHAARILAENKQWDEALELATRARGLLEEFEDRRRVARLHNACAFIHLESDPPRLDEARRHLELAEAKLADASSPADLAYVYTERARLALLEGKPEAALADADRALDNAGSDELEVARSLFLKGRALAATGETGRARSTLHQAAALFEQHGARQQEASCWREIGELDLATGDLAAAVESLRAGLTALDPRRSRA